jgi:excisionase family DNA binding protein
VRLLTVEEAAMLLRQSKPTHNRKIERGQLRAVRLGEHGPLRIPFDALTEHMRPVP